MTDELYKEYRPTTLDEIVGCEAAVKTLRQFLANNSVPHCILASGPSGCGKTTLLRILKGSLDCSDMDFKEINAADARGIDMIRDVKRSMHLAPISGKSKVFLIDECHQLTSQAQESILKMLEDTPKHVYFFLASTVPGKMLKTILTRSTIITVELLTNKQLAGLIQKVYQSELEENLREDVCDKIVELAEGSARKALVLLHQVIDCDNCDEMLNLLSQGSLETDAIQIARLLLNPRTRWKEMGDTLRSLSTTEEAESIRWLVLSYMSKVAMSGGKASGRAVMIIDEFSGNFFDTKKAGLIAACYNVIASS